MLILRLFSLRFYVQKTALELTLHYMEKDFISHFIEIKFKFCRDTFLKSFYHWTGFLEIMKLSSVHVL